MENLLLIKAKPNYLLSSANSKHGQTYARKLNKSQRDKTFFCDHDVVSLVDLGAEFFLRSRSGLSMYFLYLYQDIKVCI